MQICFCLFALCPPPPSHRSFDFDCGHALLTSSCPHVADNENSSFLFFCFMAPTLFVHTSAAQILLEIVDAYHARDIKVYFVKLRENSRELFVKSELLERAGGPQHFFRRTADAMLYIERESLVVNEVEDQV